MKRLSYEKPVIKLVVNRERPRGYGRLRPDKEAGTAGQGGYGRFAFRSNRVGFALCGSAVRAANYVRFSRHPINGLAGSAKARNGNPY